MKLSTLLVLAAVSGASIPSLVAPQEAKKVEKKGLTSKIKLEHPVEGYLTELNGKYKLRVTETTFAPGGFVDEHQSVGPGIRMVKSGQIAVVSGDKTTVYKAGDFYFEAGDVTCKGNNKTKGPAVVVNFELLPIDTGESSVIPPK